MTQRRRRGLWEIKWALCCLLYTAKHCRIFVERHSHLGRGESQWGDLKLGWGDRRKHCSSSPSRARSGEKIRITRQRCGYSLMWYNFGEQKAQESWSLVLSLSSLLWICGSEVYFLEERMGLTKWTKLLACLEVVWTFPPFCLQIRIDVQVKSRNSVSTDLG